MTIFDTRNKIIDMARARQIAGEIRSKGSRLILVTGYFDVLVVDHLRRLKELAHDDGKLMAVVLDPPESLLTPRARAELVAALAMVDYVVLAGQNDPGELLAECPADAIVREEAADLRRRQELTAHVRRRHSR
jgi:bifunctional ADP-heptose synthase (sugar kinase/adenylyltransferase)